MKKFWTEKAFTDAQYLGGVMMTSATVGALITFLDNHGVAFLGWLVVALIGLFFLTATPKEKKDTQERFNKPPDLPIG